MPGLSDARRGPGDPGVVVSEGGGGYRTAGLDQ